MAEIRVAIIGVGNCASSLVQGLEFYKEVGADSPAIPGIMHNTIGPYTISDIKIVAAFDVNTNKVDKDLSRAIFTSPNNARKFSRVPRIGVRVSPGFLGDGIAECVDREKLFPYAGVEAEHVVDVLQESGAETCASFLPTGSEIATRVYAQACIDAGIAFINGMPAFIASDPEWVKKFEAAGLPCAGDDWKSQVGATFINEVLLESIVERGPAILGSIQFNEGNDLDFRYLMEKARLTSKSISKSQTLVRRARTENITAGPSGYNPRLKNDEKIARFKIKWQGFGDTPCSFDGKLSVEDSPNAAGVAVDAIRLMRLSLDRRLTGYQRWSEYYFKHPLQTDADTVLMHWQARDLVEKFIAGA